MQRRAHDLLKLLLRCLHDMMPGHVKFGLAYSEYLSKEMSTFCCGLKVLNRGRVRAFASEVGRESHKQNLWKTAKSGFA